MPEGLTWAEVDVYDVVKEGYMVGDVIGGWNVTVKHASKYK